MNSYTSWLSSFTGNLDLNQQLLPYNPPLTMELDALSFSPARPAEEQTFAMAPVDLDMLNTPVIHDRYVIMENIDGY